MHADFYWFDYVHQISYESGTCKYQVGPTPMMAKSNLISGNFFQGFEVYQMRHNVLK